MESIQAIKNRIDSIGSTRQITQSMRLVSSAKVQKVRNRMASNRPFLESVLTLADVAVEGLAGTTHPYSTPRPVQKSAVIIISGDRGLCGGYNVNAGREAIKLLRSIGDAQLITVGVKAWDLFRRRRKTPIMKSFNGVSENPFYDDAREIAATVLDWYNKGEVDQVYVVYTRFQSMLVQIPTAKKLLPLEPPAEAPSGVRSIVRCEPGGEDFIDQVVPFYLSSFLFGAMLESSACEQSARITSMDAAVKSSNEMIDSLTLLYNQARQTAITQEIIEIVGGAGAVT